MVKRKSINVFLLDGDVSGRIKVNPLNRIIIGYKIPRTMLNECKSGELEIVKHLKQPGIYFLLGEDNNGQKFIYIGQAGKRKNGNALLERIIEHDNGVKEPYYNYWNEVIVLTTQNNSFGATEISYLEHQFVSLANKAKRYTVSNGNDPNMGNVTEEKASELEEFIDDSRLIISLLGHKAFEPILTKADDSKNEQPTFTYQGNYNAKGIFTNEGFVLLANSEISNKINPSCSKYVVNMRNINKQKISNNKTTEDILFISPSSAASFISGSSKSGNVYWKTDEGKSPKDTL